MPAPLREVGALLDARAAHQGRTAYKHLLAIAATHRISPGRVHEVIDLAGLASVADKRVGGFSLGMGQRLGIASALLGDPGTIILDEPVNGLDPEGILWIRALLRQLAQDGRTVLLSSHLMSEMTQTADHLIVMGHGSILADGPIREVIDGVTHAIVRVRTRQVDRFVAAISAPGVTVTTASDGAIEVAGRTAEQVADAAAASGVVLHEVVTVEGSLEDAYLALTAGAIEYRSATTRRITAGLPDTRVLVITTYDRDEFAFGALRAGAAGFLLKNAQPAELVEAIRTVMSGDAVVSPRITTKLIELAVPHLAGAQTGDADEELAVLSDRERDVFLQVGRGLTNTEIAHTLHLSESTVKAHLGRILTKLGLSSRVQTVILAYELGVVGRGSSQN